MGMPTRIYEVGIPGLYSEKPIKIKAQEASKY
jgi:hypothetical protein